MKRILLALVLLAGFIATTSAQTAAGSKEISFYGAHHAYGIGVNKTFEDTPFSPGFGFGWQFKYNLGSIVYWVADLYGGTDNETWTKYVDKKGIERLGSQFRNDFSVSMGVGCYIVSYKWFTLYTQLQTGLGSLRGWIVRPDEPKSELNKQQFMFAPALGCDFQVAKHWKVGIGHTVRVLIGTDLSYSTFARVSYVID